jgi:hypothetical protein
MQDKTGQPFYLVLRFRAEHTDMRSPQMAAQLSAQLGKPLTAGGVRQMLYRARDHFAAALLEEVVQSLDTPTQECLEDELLDLGLLDYCRTALGRRRSGEAPGMTPGPHDPCDEELTGPPWSTISLQKKSDPFL